MLAGIRRFRLHPFPARLALALVLTTGLSVAIVRSDRPAGHGNGDRTATAPGPPPTIPDASPPPPEKEPVPSPPASPAVDPAPPATPAPAPPTIVAPRPAAAPPPEVRRPAPVPTTATPPDPTSWTPSAGPLTASPPVRVEIAGLAVAAPVGPLGLNQDGTLEVPVKFSRAGWYTGRPTPGESGPAIIVAHRSGRSGPGAFWRLPEIRPGQQIVVTRADGRRIAFVADRVEQHRKAAFPTEAVYGPTPETALRLITCGGPFDPSQGDRYRDNVIVFAHMTGWAT